MLQLLYYLLFGTLSLFTPSLPTYLRKTRDYIYHVLILPLSIFVAAMFWGLYHWDREMVFPAWLDEMITPFFNHQKHTAIIIWSVAELCLVHHTVPSFTHGLLLAVLFPSCYLMTVMYVNYQSGVWAYPILGVLDSTGLCLFLTGCILGYVGLFWVSATLGRTRARQTVKVE